MRLWFDKLTMTGMLPLSQLSAAALARTVPPGHPELVEGQAHIRNAFMRLWFDKLTMTEDASAFLVISRRACADGSPWSS